MDVQKVLTLLAEERVYAFFQVTSCDLAEGLFLKRLLPSPLHWPEQAVLFENIPSAIFAKTKNDAVSCSDSKQSRPTSVMTADIQLCLIIAGTNLIDLQRLAIKDTKMATENIGRPALPGHRARQCAQCMGTGPTQLSDT